MFETLNKGDSGDRVIDAKWLLAGHNKWAIRTYGVPQPWTKDFGLGASKGTAQMKYKIGYAKDQCTGSFGNDLYRYLIGDKIRTDEMRQRAKDRAQVEHKEYVSPTQGHGVFIGFPGQGTHSYYYPPNNWQSDHAWDIHIPEGTPLVACHDGVIDPRIGPLGGGSRFAGIRLYVNTSDNSFYYAHLHDERVSAGQHVKAGDLLGHSGSANGVPHLHIASEHGNPLNFPLR